MKYQPQYDNTGRCIGAEALLRWDHNRFGIVYPPLAVRLAKENAALIGIEAGFAVSDMFEKVDGVYDMIVSNPPYIPKDIIPTLDPEVARFEPLAALDGGEDGLDFYRILSAESKKHLKRGGLFYAEIGYDQKEAVTEIFEKEGYSYVEVTKDLAGLDRVVKAVWNGEKLS